MVANSTETNEMTDWDPVAYTRDLIADMRAHGGVPSQGMFAGRRLLLLTTTGAKSGQERTAVVAYRPEGDGWVNAGSKSGADDDPAWVANLVAATGKAEIEVDNERFPALATVEATGPERDRLWRPMSPTCPSSASTRARPIGSSR